MKGPLKTPVYALVTLLLLGAWGCSDENAKKKSPTETVVETEAQPVEEIGDISGPMTITGVFKQHKAVEGKTVNLYETEGKDRFLIDSALIENGQYRFDLEDVEIGLYRIGILPVERVQGDIILNPNEKDIRIDYDRHSFLDHLTFSNSPENTAWMNYRTQRDQYDSDLKTIRRSKASREVKLQKILARNKQFDQLQSKLANANPNTFYSKSVRRFQSPRLNDREHYWDDIDFKDESLIHSTVLNDRLMTYMQTHAKKENTDGDKYNGFYNCTDRLANEVKERGSDRMLEFMLYITSEGFYKSGMEEVSHYVIDNYFYGDACGDAEISDLFKMRAGGIRNLQVGNTPPDFLIPDENGKNIRLSEVVQKNDYTLVLFWASFCEHCKVEIPELMTFYPAYSKKGFEVVGVSVDASKAAWNNGIKDMGSKWINVSELTSWGGPVLKEYRVTKTPVMFLLDKNGTLVARPESVGELKSFLKKKLG